MIETTLDTNVEEIENEAPVISQLELAMESDEAAEASDTPVEGFPTLKAIETQIASLNRKRAVTISSINTRESKAKEKAREDSKKDLSDKLEAIHQSYIEKRKEIRKGFVTPLSRLKKIRDAVKAIEEVESLVNEE